MSLAENMFRDYEKSKKVVLSCVTMKQLSGASRFVKLFYDKHDDFEMYSVLREFVDQQRYTILMDTVPKK
jgi:hypothetical protein